jgi:hypothetical protein
MANRKRNKEELTTKMHSEFTVSEETDRKHVVFTALHVIDQKLMTIPQAITAYGLTPEDLDKHRDEWDDLKES